MASSAAHSRFLVIGWDAADWQMIDPLLEAGQMPVLARLIEEGVMGNLATVKPVISPMLWTSIATGKTADKHGILGFTERDPETGTARPFSSVSRRTKAIWNIFQQALGWRCNTIGWWASHPAEPLDGTAVSNVFFRTTQVAPDRWRVPRDSIYPAGLEAELGPMRMGLNEINEHAVLPFIPRAGEIDQATDNRLGKLAAVLSDCISVQAVATAVMEWAPWDFTAVYFDAIDHFAHSFMHYHPPQQPHISDADFAMYQQVMTSAYRFHDLMLGRLLELAGPDATVVLCSDHGFQSGQLRPIDDPREPAGPTLWHREMGILVMKGPGIRKDERVYGATLLDIVPTLLTLAGLPVALDMDGKPLLEALTNPKPLPAIASWDEVPGRDGCHPPGTKWSAGSDESDDLMRQFAALGYIDDPTRDRVKGGEDAELEGRYNLAQSYISAARVPEALAIMEDLVRARPWESRYIHQLANVYLHGGWYRAAEELLERAYPTGDGRSTPLVVFLLRVKARLRRGDREGAAYLLSRIMTQMLRHPTTWIEAGWLWVELQQLDSAEQCFRRAVELDADSAPAWEGLCAVHLRRRENTAAIDAGLEAVQRLYHLPLTHLNLGIALARESEFDDAIVAFRRAVGMRPGMIDAHRWLAALHAKKRPDSLLAGVHRNQSMRLTRERGTQKLAETTRAEEARDLPELPTPAERKARQDEARPRQSAAAPSGRTFVLVSGLPRSGTSLMMQMLAAGGLPPQTDAVRTADVDNPEGYLEWEAIKRVAQQPQLLDEPELEHKAIKVVSALLPSLPRHHRYRVIFMRRPIHEIAASQAKMIEHRGTGTGAEAKERIATVLQTHLDDTLKFLQAHATIFDLLQVDYPALVSDPAASAARVAQFVGRELLPRADELTSAIRSELHRNRQAS